MKKIVGLAGVGVLALTVLMWSVSGGEASTEETVAAGRGAEAVAHETLPVSAHAAQEVLAAQQAPPVEATPRVQQAPPVQEAQEPPPRRRSRWWSRNRYPGPIPTPEEWQPPDGPVRIGLQVGHWRTDEAPRELSGLRRNGTSWNGTPEWEVNLEIARRTGAMLEELGYVVDILPAVVPPGYRAHLFIAVHADASNDRSARGYRVAAPRRDATGRASGIVDLLKRTYGEATGIRRLPDATRRMRNYYAFNFRRYEHALHPMTIAAILETGFLTNADDREVIMGHPERAARGIVEAITTFPITPPPVGSDAPQ